MSPRFDRIVSSIAGHLRGALTEHLGYKAAALFFASVLWLVARTQEYSEDVVAVQLDPVTDTARALTGAPPPVRAVVAGRARDLLKLFNAPPTIRRTIPPDAPETVRIELRPSDVAVPAGVEVRDVQPRGLTLTFDVRQARRVPVQSRVALTVDSALAAAGGAPRWEPDSVLVIGRRSVVERIEHVPTIAADVALHDTTPVIVALDTAGLGVRVRPTAVRVRVRAAAGRDR